MRDAGKGGGTKESKHGVPKRLFRVSAWSQLICLSTVQSGHPVGGRTYFWCEATHVYLSATPPRRERTNHEHTNLHFPCRSGAAPRLAVRKPSPHHRDTLLRFRANKFRLGTVAIFYGRERQSNRVFNDERILAFIPLSFAQNSFDSSDDSDSDMWITYWMGQRQI